LIANICFRFIQYIDKSSKNERVLLYSIFRKNTKKIWNVFVCRKLFDIEHRLCLSSSFYKQNLNNIWSKKELQFWNVKKQDINATNTKLQSIFSSLKLNFIQVFERERKNGIKIRKHFFWRNKSSRWGWRGLNEICLCLFVCLH
jgi:hypothetical protein